jgi:aquaporin Z
MRRSRPTQPYDDRLLKGPMFMLRSSQHKQLPNDVAYTDLATPRASTDDHRWWASHMLDALKHHWPEYLMEGAELGLFLISACAFVVLLEYPTSPVYQVIPNPVLRRILIGIAMGLTAIGIIYSPLGQRSGAHFNPSVTLTFFRLGKVELWDAVFYSAAQFIGGLTGVLLSALILGELVAHPSVQYAVTAPGMSGVGAAFLAEVVISFIQMSMILRVSNTRRLARFTGVVAGIMVATYISLEAPYSGMSMNPARTFASALPAQVWTAVWLYFSHTAPLRPWACCWRRNCTCGSTGYAKSSARNCIITTTNAASSGATGGICSSQLSVASFRFLLRRFCRPASPCLTEN